ncbi:MAG: glycosyltransferase family 39 protein [Chloroflexi bacterium]|nr:glycosyltransferase family 39 protein [Chloroflexota bacterium]
MQRICGKPLGRWIGKQGWLGVSLGLFALVALYINPLREAATDDDWAYARMVQHLLETGSYKLSDWASANLPFQVYWGGLFALFGGYSFSSLTFSTLFLAFVGLIAFYYLAREHGLDETQAGLLTLCLLVSPLRLRFSFNFMTDVPFLTLLTLALLLYTRALRWQSYGWMFVGSLAASAAILTRQFGLALVAGLLVTWIFSKGGKKRIYLTGLILPILAGTGQLYAGLVVPNLAAEYHTGRQVDYLTRGGELLGEFLLWRPATILHYLALFCLPLVALILLRQVSKFRRFRLLETAQSGDAAQFGTSIYLLLGLAYGRFIKKGTWLMPYLPWNFDLLGEGRFRGIITTLLTFTGAILFGPIFSRRFTCRQAWKERPVHQHLLDLTSLFLLLFHLLYFQIGDEYLLVLLPFALIALGRYLKEELLRFKIPLVVICLLLLLVSSAWTRGRLAEVEAFWKGGEYLRAIGVAPREISSFWTWYCYYSFEEYLTETNYRKLDAADLYFRWLPERFKESHFLITKATNPPSGEEWEVLLELTYQGAFFEEQHLLVVKREVKTT